MLDWVTDEGSDNIIIIEDSVKRLGNLQVKIYGNGNKLVIGEHTRLGGWSY